MPLINLVYRSYKENATPLSDWDTGTMMLVDGGPDESGCTTARYKSETFKVGSIPELSGAYYVGSLSLSPGYPYEVSYAWARWKEGDTDPDYYMVGNGDGWDLYALDGEVPDTVDIVLAEWVDGRGQYSTYSLPVVRPDYTRELPGFSLSPSTFTIPVESADRLAIGELAYNPFSVESVLSAVYDGECEGECRFWFEKDGGFTLYMSHDGSVAEHEQYSVPAYVSYIDAETGMEREERIVFSIYGFGSEISAGPYVKYVRNLASKVDSHEKVTILGGNFTDDLNVRISSSDGTRSVVVPHSELVFGEEEPWDTITFVMSPEYAVFSRGEEQCSVYDLEIGYGDSTGFSAVAGTGDAKMAFENNVGLIRYRYDSETVAEQKKASAGVASTTNVSCFSTTELNMVYDTTDSSGNPSQAGGASGKYGKTMYVRMSPGQDCSEMLYVRVKAKLNTRLDYRHGEMTINGVHVVEGDIVWLDGQKDGETDGLWVVQPGEWVGLKSYMDTGSGEYDPCSSVGSEPLPVDSGVLVDLGARVSDTADLRCTEDVPVKYGTQKVCGSMAEPGMRVLLYNQTDGRDGLWEVTCTDWVYWGPVKDTGSTSFDMSDGILVQNDIDFCACRDGRTRTIFNIEYYYLNADCYLATATRKVKLICAGGASVVPNSNLVITDYSITLGAEPSLVTDTHSTAGDPEPEDCTRATDTFDIDHMNSTTETTHGCGELGTPIKAPTCEMICDCERYYNLPESFDGTSVKTGYSIVFWKLEEDGWHLYSYNRRVPVAYDVYHLHVRGIAGTDMVDENTDVYLLDEKNLPTSERTKDAWFEEHGGKLFAGFSMYDSKWKFRVEDEHGELAGWTDELGPDTLYQAWALHGGKEGTRILAHGEDGAAPVGTRGIYGFRFYDTPLTLQRFCDIYNRASTGCIFPATAGSSGEETGDGQEEP